MGTGKRRILTEEVSIFDHLISWTSKPEVNELKPVQLALQSVVSMHCSLHVEVTVAFRQNA